MINHVNKYSLIHRILNNCEVQFFNYWLYVYACVYVNGYTCFMAHMCDSWFSLCAM